jgi:acetyltransferase-like isoleucine patch superfamily enzyme
MDTADYVALDAAGLRVSGLHEAGHLDSGSRLEVPCSILGNVVSGARIELGAFCNISGETISNVRFGRYCSVSAGVVLGSHEHPTDWLTTSRIAYYPEVWDRLIAGDDAGSVHARKRPCIAPCPMTDIGPDVWLGEGAFIRAGVRIGPGAIVGARATVLRDVPPYAIVAGTPARVVRLRFPDAVVDRLLALEWWRYAIYHLFDAPMDSIEASLDVIEDLVARGAVSPYAGRLITPDDLANPKALAAELAPAPVARAI